tara:strand:- start:1498 stop:1821 length:324 start_codon:yes stop_codon:yes gene_type:complete
MTKVTRTVTIDGIQYPRLSLSEVRMKLRILAEAYSMPELDHLAKHLERKHPFKKASAPVRVTLNNVDATDRKVIELCLRNHPEWTVQQVALFTGKKVEVVKACCFDC